MHLFSFSTSALGGFLDDPASMGKQKKEGLLGFPLFLNFANALFLGGLVESYWFGWSLKYTLELEDAPQTRIMWD